MLGTMPGPQSALIKHKPCFAPEDFTTLQHSQMRQSPAWAGSKCSCSPLASSLSPLMGQRGAGQRVTKDSQLSLPSLNGSVSFCFLAICVARGILIPQPEIELAPPAVEVCSLIHRTAGEVPESVLCISL